MSVAKLSPVNTFSIVFVSLSIIKSSPMSFLLLTLLSYGKQRKVVERFEGFKVSRNRTILRVKRSVSKDS